MSFEFTMEEIGLKNKLEQLDQLQSPCNDCGLCLEGCATFQTTGWEHESPRGRLRLAELFIEGNIPLQSDALSSFDRCLGCGACEALCPQKVSYGRVRDLVQELRSDLKLIREPLITTAIYQKWITTAYRISSRRWRRFAGRWITIPSIRDLKNKTSLESNCLEEKRPRMKVGSSFSSKQRDPVKGAAILATCCVQDLWMHEQIEEAIAFVKRLGEELCVDPKQPCCGAIFERLARGGEESVYYRRQQAKVASIQAKTQQAFNQWKPERFYFLSIGCQAHHANSSSAEDLYAWIESLLDSKNGVLSFSVPRKIYYQPYCKKSLDGEDSVRRLINRIQGAIIQDIPFSLSCCGGYCGEAFLHPEQAKAIGDNKVNMLLPGAELVVTSQDCWGVFNHLVERKDLKVYSPLKLIMEADLKFF